MYCARTIVHDGRLASYLRSKFLFFVSSKIYLSIIYTAGSSKCAITVKQPKVFVEVGVTVWGKIS